MGREAAQVPALMVRVMVVVTLIPVSRVTQAIKAIRVDIISSPAREINNNDLGIKAIQNN